MSRMVVLLVAVVAINVSADAGDRYVTVPDTTWPQLLPYVEANLRVDYAEGTMTVGASGAVYERKLFEPYDEALGEFATVLLGEGLGERRIQKAIERATQSIKRDGVKPDSISRDELAAAVWERLAADDQFNRSLQGLFLEAQAAGRLSCLICERGFAPQHLEVR